MMGQTISHYNILEKLGAGGMGVVYKAHDTKLDRDVALKFLPHHLSATPEEQARFLQEARAAAALNHPNICTIYDVVSEGDRECIVMELVEGKTLRGLIENGKWSIGERVGLAIQIGEALEEAHTHGIVHRDVKTDNIMVNAKNQVKVMDFGLAKLKGSLKLTKTSSTVGTLAYMAPEQIQAGEVDARSDIFSFGVVLYEMLTGHLPFRGEHEAAIMYSILNEEAIPLQKYVPEASSEIAHVVNTALEKNAEERYQSASEMVRDLRRAHKQTSRVSRTLVNTGHGLSDVPSSRTMGSGLGSRKKVWVTLGAAGVFLGAAGVVFLSRTPAVEVNPHMTSRELRIPFTQMSYPNMSQDGNFAVFVAADENGRWDVYSTPTSNPQVLRLTQDSAYQNVSAAGPDISPDMSQVVYEWFHSSLVRDELRVVSVTGGHSKHLAWDGIMPRWLPPDGRRIVYLASRTTPGKLEFRSVRPDGEEDRLEFVDSLGLGAGPFSYSMAPDGQSVVWTRNSRDDNFGEAIVRDLRTGNEYELTHDRKHIDEVCWAPNGQILFSSNRSGSVNVWMVSAQGGEPVLLPVGGSVAIRISRDGKRLLCFQNQVISHLWSARGDGSDPRQITRDESRIGSPHLSPDGNYLACRIGDPDYLSDIHEIYIMDRDGRSRRQRTAMGMNATRPLWSPDGKWISFYTTPPWTTTEIRTHVLAPFDAEKPQYLGRGIPIAWANNREVITFDSGRSWIVPIDGTPRRPFYKDSTRAVPVLGGSQILYVDLRATVQGLWIVPAAAQGPPTRLLPVPWNYRLAATNDRHFLFELQGIGWRISWPGGKLERLQRRFRWLDGFSISPDGNEIVYAESEDRGKIVMYENMFR